MGPPILVADRGEMRAHDLAQGTHSLVPVDGFRSTFRDWAAERTGYPNHVVEMALAHAVGNKVEAATGAATCSRSGGTIEKSTE